MCDKPKTPLVEVRDLKKYFDINTGVFSSKQLKAVDGISFDIAKGETLGLVGESGCGKTTVGRTLLHLYTPTSGSIIYDGKEVVTKADIANYRKKATMVFQDPYSSLNPRMTVSDIIAEPLDIHKLYTSKEERRERVLELMDHVGLNSEHASRYAPSGFLPPAVAKCGAPPPPPWINLAASFTNIPAFKPPFTRSSLNITVNIGFPLSTLPIATSKLPVTSPFNWKAMSLATSAVIGATVLITFTPLISLALAIKSFFNDAAFSFMNSSILPRNQLRRRNWKSLPSRTNMVEAHAGIYFLSGTMHLYDGARKTREQRIMVHWRRVPTKARPVLSLPRRLPL